MSIDFNNLPKPQMVENVDFEALLQERKEDLIQRWEGEADQNTVRQILMRESEPLTKFLEENVYRETLLRNRINQTALSTLLAFAEKTDLDAVVANYGLTRLLVLEATATNAAIYETDEELRHRASLVFDSLSVAGPKSAYEYHALNADGRIADVKASSPKPCEALVTILQKNTSTGEAEKDVLDKVFNYLSDESRRPVGDRLIVQSVQAITFNISAQLFSENTPESDSLLQQAKANIQNYMEKSKRIGRSIYLSQLYQLLHVTGVSHVVIQEPKADVLITETQVAYCTNIKLVAVAQ